MPSDWFKLIEKFPGIIRVVSSKLLKGKKPFSIDVICHRDTASKLRTFLGDHFTVTCYEREQPILRVN